MIDARQTLMERLEEIGVVVEPEAELVARREEVTIASMRTSSGDPGIRGSTTTSCEECGEAVYMAPSSASLLLGRLRAGNPTCVLCVQCMVQRTEKEDA